MIRSRFALFLLGMALLLTARSASAQTSTIQDIRVQGTYRIDGQVVREAMSLRVHEPFRLSQANDDLKAIYRLGYFEDVKVTTEESSSGVIVLVTVKERPWLRSVQFDGNSKVDTEDLEKELHLKIFAVLDPQKITEAIGQLKAAYDREGFFLAEIEAERKEVSPQEVDLVFHIREGKRVRIRQILFLGNDRLSDRALRKAMGTKKAHLFSFLTKAGTYDEQALKADVQRIVYAYQEKGYLDAKIGEPRVVLDRDRTGLEVTFSVAEGEAYRVGTVGVSGDLIFPEGTLTKDFHLKKGETFKRSNLEKDVQSVNEKYSDEGHFYVNVRPVDQRQPEKQLVDFVYEIEKGPVVFFEDINISGNTITRDKVVRRELKVHEGERFHLTNLKKSVEAVRRLGYFESVSPSTPRGSADDRVDLNLEIKEKPTGTFSVGAGYSSVDKFLFNAQISKENFLGLGLRGALSGQLSGKRRLFNVSLTDPYFLDTNWLVGVTAFQSDVEYTDFSRQSIGSELQVGRPLFELFSTAVTYRIEQVAIDDVDPALEGFFTDGLTSSVLWSITRDGRDNRIFPKKGTYNSLALELAGGPFGGDNEFFKAQFNSRFYLPIWKEIVFASQGTFGYIGTVTGKEPPIFERFFLGGINSLRGYESRSIGSTRQVVGLDPASGDYAFVIGGNKELFFNHELTFPLIPQVDLRGLVFFDWGNAYDDDENIDLTDIRASYGFGVRWYSPLGPLRFEFGIPINPRPEDKTSAFEFTIGASF